MTGDELANWTAVNPPLTGGARKWVHQVFEDAGFPVSKPELSALFRAPGHKNFRLCGDQMLRNFLKGLTLRFRGE